MKKIFVAIILLNSLCAYADNEISLFSASGEASAYIALSEELTIYLWTGEPVAYLTEDSSGGYHVYGFNGKHLGWFLSGVIRDHKGDAACGTKEVMQKTKYESYKSYKQYKPFKAYKEYAPYRPILSNQFGQIPCKFLLASGSAN